MKSKYVIIGAVALTIIVDAAVDAYTFLSNPSASTETTAIKNAGATFPHTPLGSIITKYTNDIKPNDEVSHHSIVNSGGISALNTKIIDLVPSSTPLNVAEATNITNSVHETALSSIISNGQTLQTT